MLHDDIIYLACWGARAEVCQRSVYSPNQAQDDIHGH